MNFLYLYLLLRQSIMQQIFSANSIANVLSVSSKSFLYIAIADFLSSSLTNTSPRFLYNSPLFFSVGVRLKARSRVSLAFAYRFVNRYQEPRAPSNSENSFLI